jgi:hypothetical protein
MPKVALADTLLEWDGLLTAAAEKGAGVAGLEDRLAQLRAALERARELDARRQRLEAERQQATQELAAIRREGQDLTTGIRGMLLATFGPRWQGLVQFGIRPFPTRRRSAASRKASAPPSDSTEPSTPLDR